MTGQGVSSAQCSIAGSVLLSLLLPPGWCRLVIEDQSAQHAGHAAMRAATAAGKAGSSGETHFRVEVVSEAFTGQNLVQRQRTVYKVGHWLCCCLSLSLLLLHAILHGCVSVTDVARPCVTVTSCCHLPADRCWKRSLPWASMRSHWIPRHQQRLRQLSGSKGCVYVLKVVQSVTLLYIVV
jgi:stress-induced morphogen